MILVEKYFARLIPPRPSAATTRGAFVARKCVEELSVIVQGLERTAERRGEDEPRLERDRGDGRGGFAARGVLEEGCTVAACVQPPLGTWRIPHCALFIRFNFISSGCSSSMRVNHD